jgi:hypothetical protein
MSTAQYYYPQPQSQPIAMSTKSKSQRYYAPSDAADSMQSYGGSATSASSYAGSASGEYDYNTGSSSSASGVDLMDLLNDRMANQFDPLPLDRNLAAQAQA